MRVCLGPFGSLLEPLGASWEGLGGLLGRCWGPWRGLGTSCGGLGGYVGTSRFSKQIRTEFMTILGSKKGAKREPKCSQKRSKIEAEIEDEKGRSLGPCLGRLGVVLVLTLESKIIKIH